MAGMLNPYGGPFRLAGAGMRGLKGLGKVMKGAKNPLVKEILGGLKNPMGVGKILPGFGKTLYGGRHKKAPGGRTAPIALIPGCGILRVRPRWSCGCILIIMDTT